MKRQAQHNLSTWRPSLVTLLDGRQVASDSEEWRAECEAREVLRWPLAKRRDYLFGKEYDDGERRGGIEKYRGKAGLQALLKTIDQLHRAAKAGRE